MDRILTERFILQIEAFPGGTIMARYLHLLTVSEEPSVTPYLEIPNLRFFAPWFLLCSPGLPDGFQSELSVKYMRRE